MDNKLSDAQIEQLVDSGKASGVIEQALISDELEDVVLDIEERHAEILKLEKAVLEVFELFKDLAELTNQQQDSLDRIEANVTSAGNNVTKGAKALVEAEEYQQKARKRQCCILVIVACVLVAILAPVLINVYSKS